MIEDVNLLHALARTLITVAFTLNTISVGIISTLVLEWRKENERNKKRLNKVIKISERIKEESREEHVSFYPKKSVKEDLSLFEAWIEAWNITKVQVFSPSEAEIFSTKLSQDTQILSLLEEIKRSTRNIRLGFFSISILMSISPIMTLIYVYQVISLTSFINMMILIINFMFLSLPFVFIRR